MAKKTREKPSDKRAIRYSDADKEKILQFVADYDREHGRGGQSAAAEKFGVSAMSISKWRNKAAPTKRASRAGKNRKAKGATDPKHGETKTVLERMLSIQSQIDELKAEFEALKARL